MQKSASSSRAVARVIPTSLSRIEFGRYRRTLLTHAARWHWTYLLIALGALSFHARFALGANVTASLPYRLFLIDKQARPTLGQYVAFRWPGGGPYPAGVIFVKEIVGVAGDVVTRRGHDFYVNEIPVGTAKAQSRLGQPLLPGPTGILPTGRYYVFAPHPDSLDSRYALMGWLPDAQIIGRAYVVF